ncbi:Crp/Fnr family transcriptional regulator [Dyadobacter sp. CY261]|uniref:Crp/Fnr family transcriptional regulator n=1 Tax=Dyadobacter sp. CY261 TaxID=2907203 RepID=UPI001F31348E|nr:Crp/Fnr family transcriptional regulator [Dyadobacter sp. CY261]MCF0075714.1 Crp/Fnr family transcriptional regulator [Dyadobacter sp. CY261]
MSLFLHRKPGSYNPFLRSKNTGKQYILQDGDVARCETFIVKGVTRTYEVDDRGQEHILQFGLEDWWVGDLYSFLTETPTTYNIDCLEDAHVLHITKADLETLYETVPKMERHLRIMIQNAFIASTKRLSASLAKSAPERYEEFVKKYLQIEQRVANHQIASYLGITTKR